MPYTQGAQAWITQRYLQLQQSVVSQCSLNAWLSGWLVEISAYLWEAVVHYRRFATMCYTNPRTLIYFTFNACLYLISVHQMATPQTDIEDI